ncbi:MAG TPA: ABC transporter permease [Candidatus Acidoferrales bacterium]|nr:ABC transporter permease [Candidatus Acidoferrales bacterium]
MGRLRRLFHKSREEKRLDAELQYHVERQTADYVAEGMNVEEARRKARQEHGGLEQLKQECREARRTHLAEEFVEDVRHGLRLLRKSPGFAAVAIFTLALGIGANTALFSVVQGVVLAPLPYQEPDRLVVVWQKNLTQNYDASVSYPDFLDWRRNSQSFARMAAITPQSFDLTGPGTAEHLEGDEVSAGFFELLGAQLELGREFSPAEEWHGGPPVAIISDQMWTNRFARSPQTLGQFVTLDGLDYTIVGVLPSEFHFLGNADVFVPAGQEDPLILNDRTIHSWACIARLRPRMTVEQAQVEMDGIQENLNRLYPAVDRGLATTLMPLKQALVGNVGGTLFLLLGAVGTVLLIACVNVANLLLAHSAARKREFAIRAALGANRARIMRHLLTESLLLSFLGSVIGLVAAKWGLGAVIVAVGQELPRTSNIGINVPVLLFASGVSLAVGVLCGLVPALQGSSSDPQESLKEGGRESSRAHHRVQSSLVISQLVLTVVLLTGAGLLFHTIRRLWAVDPGLDPQHVITFKVGLSPWALKTSSGIRNAFMQLSERLRQIPGVQAADLTSVLPLSPEDNTGPFWFGLEKPASMAEAPRALYFEVGPDYLETMGIALIRGRFFTPEDTVHSEPVVVIDDALARSFLPGKDPIGQRVTIAHWTTARIIGVVGHVKHWGLGNSTRLSQGEIYISFFQLSDDWVPLFRGQMTMAVRTRLDTTVSIPAIRAVVSGSSSDQPIYQVETMKEIVSDSMSSQRLPLRLLGAFAGLALLLASIGIYGVISYSVGQRVREIGIRMALGAEKSDVLGMVIGHGLRLALVGLAIGAAAALTLTRLLSSFSHLLYGVGAGDPATYLAVSLVLITMAVLACYVPARRAMKVDPMVALRYE